MGGHSSSWLLLSVVGLAALVAAELHYQVGTGTGRQGASTGKVASAAVPVPLFALEDREKLSDTLTRPLFMPNRQPLEAGAQDAAQLPSPAARPKANRYALSAIIIVDDERVALLTDTATGGLSRVREGESLAGWRVEEINESGAVLSNGDTREELALRSFGPPVVQPAPRRVTDATGRPASNAAGALPNRPRRPKRGPRQIQTIPRASSN
jgi:hypothetical protein